MPDGDGNWLPGDGERRQDTHTRRRLGEIQFGYARLSRITYLFLILIFLVQLGTGIAVGFLYGHRAQTDRETARRAGAAAARSVGVQIQRERADSLRSQCADQNRKNRRAIASLRKQLVVAERVVADRRRVAIREHQLALTLGGQPDAHRHAVEFVDALLPPPQAQGAIALINRLQPPQDCSALVRKRVGRVPR